MNYYELSPAYGKDYQTKAQVTAAWAEGKDFTGDYALGFQLVNIESIPKPCTIRLRYQGNRKFATVTVLEGALASK